MIRGLRRAQARGAACGPVRVQDRWAACAAAGSDRLAENADHALGPREAAGCQPQHHVPPDIAPVIKPRVLEHEEPGPVGSGDPLPIDGAAARFRRLMSCGEANRGRLAARVFISPARRRCASRPVGPLTERLSTRSSAGESVALRRRRTRLSSLLSVSYKIRNLVRGLSTPLGLGAFRGAIGPYRRALGCRNQQPDHGTPSAYADMGFARGTSDLSSDNAGRRAERSPRKTAGPARECLPRPRASSRYPRRILTS